MAKPKLHRLDGGGHKLRGRRKGAKARTLIANAPYYFNAKHFPAVVVPGHITPASRLVAFSETPEC